jgi:hypothetical protein
MEDTELQDELLTKPLEWSYNPIYPKKTMNSKIERQASLVSSMERILFTSSHCTISELHALSSDEGRDELDTNPLSKSK